LPRPPQDLTGLSIFGIISGVCHLPVGPETAFIGVYRHFKSENVLAEIIHALNAVHLGFGLRQRRKEQARQNGDDCYCDQQLDERESSQSPGDSHATLIGPISRNRNRSIPLLSV
jgi:hypothetical protein